MADSLSAQERVVHLLRTLHEARVDWDWRGGDDAIPLGLMPSMYNEGSYQELEHRLAEMRDGEYRRPWWHVCHRYRFGISRSIVVPVTRKASGAHHYHLPQRTELVARGPFVMSKRAEVRVYQWLARVDNALVQEGVEVLTALMYEGEIDRIWLPAVVHDRVLGARLVAA